MSGTVSLRIKVEGNGTEDGPQVCSFAAGPPGLSLAGLEFVVFGPPEASSSGAAAATDGPLSDKKRRRRALVVDAAGGAHAASAGAGAQALFVGRNFKGAEHRFAPQTHAVALFDPSTGKLKVAPVPHMFQLDQFVELAKQDSSERGGREDSDVNEDGAGSESEAGGGLADRVRDQWADGRRDLVAAFGSRKRLRQLRSEIDNKVDTRENASAAAVVAQSLSNNAAEAAAVVARNAEAAAAAARAVVPPHNADALEPAGIYPIELLVPAAVRQSEDQLRSVLESIERPGRPEAVALSDFVRDRLSYVHGLSGGTRPLRPFAECVLYAYYLAEFDLLHPRRGGKPAQVQPARALRAIGFDESVLQELLARFTERRQDAGDAVRYELTQELADKLRCHLAVATLVMSDFVVHQKTLLLLAKYLQITAEQCHSYFLAVGARARGAGVKRSVLLAAPLELPKVQSSRGRRG